MALVRIETTVNVDFSGLHVSEELVVASTKRFVIGDNPDFLCQELNDALTESTENLKIKLTKGLGK